MFYFKNNDSLTVYFQNGDIAVWNKEHANYKAILDNCINMKWFEIEVLHNQTKHIMQNDSSITEDNQIEISNSSNEKVTVKCNNTLTKLIKLLKDKGCIKNNLKSIKPFLKNCLKNPYIDAIQELYEYCLAMDFEITEDGCFLAYKYVNNDLTSCYDNKTQHKIGEVTKVNIFDTNRRNTCSKGLHFCSKEYLKVYSGDTTIIVKVNPMHVCSIPIDYNNQKGRTTEYITVGIMGKDGNLQTTNIEFATGEKVVKTEEKANADKKLAKTTNRIKETADLIEKYTNLHPGEPKENIYEQVAKHMFISVETVKRNYRKFKANKDN